MDSGGPTQAQLVSPQQGSFSPPALSSYPIPKLPGTSGQSWLAGGWSLSTELLFPPCALMPFSATVFTQGSTWSLPGHRLRQQITGAFQGTCWFISIHKAKGSTRQTLNSSQGGVMGMRLSKAIEAHFPCLNATYQVHEK